MQHQEEKQASVSPWQEDDSSAEFSSTANRAPAAAPATTKQQRASATHAPIPAAVTIPSADGSRSGSSLGTHAPETAATSTPVKPTQQQQQQQAPHVNLTPRQEIVRGTPVSLPPVGSPMRSRGGKHPSQDLADPTHSGNSADASEPSTRSNPLRQLHPAFAAPHYTEGHSRPSSGVALNRSEPAPASPSPAPASPAPAVTHQSPARQKRMKHEGPSALGPASPVVPFSYDDLPTAPTDHGGYHPSPIKTSQPMSQAALAVEQQRAIMHRVARADFDDDEMMQVHAQYPAGLASHAITAASQPTQSIVKVQRTPAQAGRSPQSHDPRSVSPSRVVGGSPSSDPNAKAPFWRAAHDPAYVGVRSEFGSPATFLAPDYSLVALPDEVDMQVRASANPQARAAQLLGHSEISAQLRQMAHSAEGSRSRGVTPSAEAQKYDSRSDATLRAALHKQELSPLVAAQARDAAARRRARHEAGFEDSQDDESDARQMQRLERELLPQRVGLPWFNVAPELAGSVGSSPQQQQRSNHRSPTRQMGSSKSTPSLRGGGGSSGSVVSPSMSSHSLQLVSSSGAQQRLTAQASAANLATHYSNTGKLLQLNGLRSSAAARGAESVAPIIAQIEVSTPHGSRTQPAKVHIASMAAMVASATVALGVTGQPLPQKGGGLLSNPAESALHAVPPIGPSGTKYQPCWPASKVSQFEVHRAGQQPGAANARAVRAFQAMPLEYQAHLMPPSKIKAGQNMHGTVARLPASAAATGGKPGAAGRRSADYSSPGSSHGARNIPGSRGGQLSPLKSLLSSLNSPPSAQHHNVFGNTQTGPDESLNPYQSYLLNPNGGGQGRSASAAPGALWTDAGFNRSAAVAAARATDEKEGGFDSHHSNYSIHHQQHTQSHPVLPTYQQYSQPATRAPTRDGRDSALSHYPSANPTHTASNPNLGHNSVGHRYTAVEQPFLSPSSNAQDAGFAVPPRTPIPVQNHGFESAATEAARHKAAQLAATGGFLSKEGAYSHQLSLVEDAASEAAEAAAVAAAQAHAQAQSRTSTGPRLGTSSPSPAPVVMVPQTNDFPDRDPHAGAKHVFGKTPLGGLGGGGGVGRAPSAGSVYARPMTELTEAALSAHEEGTATQPLRQQQQQQPQPLEPWQQPADQLQQHQQQYASASDDLHDFHAAPSHPAHLTVSPYSPAPPQQDEAEEDLPAIGASPDVFERAVFVEETGAATSIQAAFRGHAIRKKMKQQQQPTTTAATAAEQASAIEGAPAGHTAELHSREEPTDSAEPAAAPAKPKRVRKHVGFSEEEPEEVPAPIASAEEHQAATVLQAAHRGRQVRLEQKQLKQQRAQSASSAVSVRFEGTSEEHDAATRIQALQRGRQARAAAAQAARTVAAPELPVIGTAEENQAAAKIQALQRGRLVRKSMPSPALRKRPQSSPSSAQLLSAAEATAEQHEAATKLQSLQRGRQVRMGLKSAQSAQSPQSQSQQQAQAQANEVSSRYFGVSNPTAATAGGEVGASSEKFDRDASVVESEAATAIQSVYRGHSVRKQAKAATAGAGAGTAAGAKPTPAVTGTTTSASKAPVPARSGASISAAANKSSAPAPAPVSGSRTGSARAGSAHATASTQVPSAAVDAAPSAEPDNFGFTGTKEEHGVARMLQAKARSRNSAKQASLRAGSAGSSSSGSAANSSRLVISSEDFLGLSVSPMGSTRGGAGVKVVETPSNSRQWQIDAQQAELRDAQKEAQLREAQRRAAKRIRQAKRAEEAKARAALDKAAAAVPAAEVAPVSDDLAVVVSSDTDSELDESPAVDPSEASVLAALSAATVAHPAQSRADANRAALSTIDSYLYEQHQHAAATKIQAVQRGRSVRRQMRAERRAEAGLPPVAPPQQLPPTHSHAHHGADVLSIDQESEEAHAAAAKIQALHRGRSVRRQFTHAHAHAAHASTAVPHENAVIDGSDRPPTPLSDHYKRHIAAVKIQALARGRAVRNKHGHIMITGFEHQNGEALRRALAEWNEAEEERKRVLKRYADLAAAASSQTWTEYTENQKKAAAKIQAVQRGRMVRRKRAQEKRQAALAKSRAEAEAAAAALAAAAAADLAVAESIIEEEPAADPIPEPVVAPVEPAPVVAAPVKPRNRTKAEIFAGPPTPPGGWPKAAPTIEPIPELPRADSMFGDLLAPLAAPSPELLAQHEERLAALATGERWHAIDAAADAEAHREAEAAAAAAAAAAAKRKTRRASQAVPVSVSASGTVSLRDPKRSPAGSPALSGPKRAPQPVREYSAAEQEAAAIQIQRVVRGHSVRKRHRVGKHGAGHAKAAAAASSSVDADMAARANTRAALRASQRRSQAPAKDSPQRSPTLAARQPLSRMLSTSVSADAASGTPAEHEAATKLQALQRGRLVRKESAAQRSELQLPAAASS